MQKKRVRVVQGLKFSNLKNKAISSSICRWKIILRDFYSCWTSSLILLILDIIEITMNENQNSSFWNQSISIITDCCYNANPKFSWIITYLYNFYQKNPVCLISFIQQRTWQYTWHDSHLHSHPFINRNNVHQLSKFFNTN